MPEAQLDRFMFKILVRFPSKEELRGIVELTEGMQSPDIQRQLDAQGLLSARALVSQIPIADAVMDYLLEVVMATHTPNTHIREGASPRAAQAMIRAARAKAFLEGRFNVSFQDVKEMAYPVLRHRILLSFDAISEGVNEDQIIQRILEDKRYDAGCSFFDRLSRLRLAMGYKSLMNMAGNRKSMQKGSSTEFSDFREYMPGDDIRRIDWNAYGRLDRLYVKEYMEEKEAVVSILIDTSASMDYGVKKKGELACMLAAALAYMGLNNMDRMVLYDMQNMQQPFMAGSGKKSLPMLTGFLSRLSFEERVDIEEAVRRLPARGQAWPS